MTPITEKLNMYAVRIDGTNNCRFAIDGDSMQKLFRSKHLADDWRKELAAVLETCECRVVPVTVTIAEVER